MISGNGGPAADVGADIADATAAHSATHKKKGLNAIPDRHASREKGLTPGSCALSISGAVLRLLSEDRNHIT